MPFNEHISNQIREALLNCNNVTEKHMFGGICYLVNDKMCVGVVGDEMMCRIGEENYADALEQNGCREMVFTGRPMKGYVFVEESVLKTRKDFQYWVDLCLEFNPKAKMAKKRSQ